MLYTDGRQLCPPRSGSGEQPCFPAERDGAWQKTPFGLRHCWSGKCGHHRGTWQTRPNASACSPLPWRHHCHQTACCVARASTACEGPPPRDKLACWRNRPTPIHTASIDVALDVEQLVDAPNRLQAERRYHRRLLALSLSPRGSFDVSQHKEFPARMRPTAGFQDQTRTTASFIKLAVAAIGIGLQDAGISGEVGLRMFAAAVARIVKHRRRRRRAVERPVIAHIDPGAGKLGFAVGQHRNRRRHRNAAELGRHHMCAQPREQRHQHRRYRAPTWSAKVDRLSGTPSRA